MRERIARIGHPGQVVGEAAKALAADRLAQLGHPAEVRVDGHRRGPGVLGHAAQGDAEGAIVDGGLAAQAERAMLNVGLALEAAGASEDDLVKLTIHVVDWTPEKLAELGAGLMAAAEARPRPRVPITPLGAATLYEPGMLVEIEAIAVAD